MARVMRRYRRRLAHSRHRGLVPEDDGYFPFPPEEWSGDFDQIEVAALGCGDPPKEAPE